ncbi:MAG: hypothetical protein J7K40_13645 [candidate division Zixibacteria bacterium]|nr:hypothetical protein [candidate division Zixibacteria bacterium]
MIIMESLAEALPREQERVREILGYYKEIPAGQFGAIMIESALHHADKAAASGDVIQMIKAYEALCAIEC